jgi:catalase
LLQGRLFSYTDTQLSRLGGPNFHQIPVNRPRCPMHNFQRDALMQMEVPKGRVNYEPNSLAPDSPRENPDAGFVTYPDTDSGDKVRVRSETFKDHYSQARMFFRSMTAPEQDHIVNAFAFELGKVETPEVRCRVLGHVKNVDAELCDRVEQALGMPGQAYTIPPAKEPIDMAPSPALSLLAKARPTLAGRKIGVLVSDGFEMALLEQLQALAEAEGAVLQVIGPTIGKVKSSGKETVTPDHAIAAAPSVLFDTVAVCAPDVEALKGQAAALNFLRDAYAHLKFIGITAASMPLLEAAGIAVDDAVIEMETRADAAAYVEAAKQGRFWPRAAVIKA